MMNLRSLTTIARRAKSSSALSSQSQSSLNRIRTQHSSNGNGNGNVTRIQHASFSTDEKKDKKKDSLRDTVNRLKGDAESSSSSSSSSSSAETNEMFSKAADAFSSFTSTLTSTWEDLLNSSKPNDINKQIHQSHPGFSSDDDNEAADKYEGSSAVMIIEEKENLNAFERIQRRLSDAPIIQGIFASTEQLYENSGAKNVKAKMDDVKEDAREAWETSQNPWVYRVSSVYDTITAESEFAMAERELRELDPEFSIEKWKEDLIEVTLPKIMQLFLEGRIKELKPTLGEAVYNRIAAEARVRKKEGVYVDTNVLGIMNSEILSCTPDHVNKGSPIIMLHFMCQQINCVRKKEGGEIVEGSEDDIRAYSYVAAFQREYDEEKGELNWKIVDFMLNGAIAYL
jgi:import inner membrane translocase subunit TIM44